MAWYGGDYHPCAPECRLNPQHAGLCEAPIVGLKSTKQAARDRRERIATACLGGMLAVDGIALWSESNAALHALRYADALIAELDK